MPTNDSALTRRVRAARERVRALASDSNREADSTSKTDSRPDNAPSGRTSEDMVREAVHSATMSPPTQNSLETMDGRERVTQMARAGAATGDWVGESADVREGGDDGVALSLGAGQLLGAGDDHDEGGDVGGVLSVGVSAWDADDAAEDDRGELEFDDPFGLGGDD